MLSSLQTQFNHPNLRFYQQDQLVMVELKNAYGQATLTTHGATLLSYIPQGGDDLLYVSETAVYDGTKPVRGGVPVCWPWFGAHPTDSSQKAHGIARYELWQVEAVSSVGEATQVTLCLTPNANTQKAWPHDFKLSLIVTLGEKLEVELKGENLSQQDWTVSEALHTYFRVAQAPGLLISGLEGASYFDKNRDFAEFTQTESLKLQAPMDCVYVDHSAAVKIHDQGRNILIEKQNSASTIVWNPGEQGVKSFADMPDADYQIMLCVEAGNALQNSYSLAAGQSHSLKMWLSAE